MLAVIGLFLAVEVWAVFSFLAPNYREKINSRMELLSLDPDERIDYLKKYNERVVSIEDSLKAIKDNPVLGIGFGSFVLVSRNEIFLPHNWILSNWVAAGVPGLIAIVFLFYKSMRGMFTLREGQEEKKSERIGLSIALVLVWFHGLVRPVEFNPSFYALVIWAISRVKVARIRQTNIYDRRIQKTAPFIDRKWNHKSGAI
jgi:hypothetical protein